MKCHFFIAPITVILLPSTPGCSKNSEPAPASATGSYQLDNKTITLSGQDFY